MDGSQEKVALSRQQHSGHEIIEDGISARHACTTGRPALLLAPLSAHGAALDSDFDSTPAVTNEINRSRKYLASLAS